MRTIATIFVFLIVAFSLAINSFAAGPSLPIQVITMDGHTSDDGGLEKLKEEIEDFKRICRKHTIEYSRTLLDHGLWNRIAGGGTMAEQTIAIIDITCISEWLREYEMHHIMPSNLGVG